MLANVEGMDLNSILKFMLVMIIPFLGLIAMLENIVSNFKKVNNNYSKGEDQLMQTRNEINSLLFCEQDTISGKEYCACSFCGKICDIITRCSSCKKAIYCSKVCHVMHWRFWHKDECVETEAAQDNEGLSSPSHGTPWFVLEAENETSEYSISEDEQKTCDEGREGQVSVYGDGCAVCGNPSSKKCSRCKTVKYCSQTCQHFHWRSGHKFECFVYKENLTQAASVNQERPADENVLISTNSIEVKDTAHSYGPLCLEFYSGPQGNTDAKSLVLGSQEATNKVQEVEEQLTSLKQELEMIKSENMSLQSERDDWKKRARHSENALCRYKKEHEHQLTILGQQNQLISNSEKQACQMVQNLSQRLHCLQITVETGVAARNKQEEYIHMLQNQCAKAKKEIQEQYKFVERLKKELDNASQFPVKVAEDTGQKLTFNSSAVVADESKDGADEVPQAISLSRNLTFTRQACSICLTNEKDLAFGCGHMTCRECGSKIRKCHICRKKIANRINLFPG